MIKTKGCSDKSCINVRCDFTLLLPQILDKITTDKWLLLEERILLPLIDKCDHSKYNSFVASDGVKWLKDVKINGWAYVTVLRQTGISNFRRLNIYYTSLFLGLPNT